MYYNSYVNKSCDGESSLSRDAKRVGYGVSRRKELSMKITPELPPEASVGRAVCLTLLGRILVDMWINNREAIFIFPFPAEMGFFIFWRVSYEGALYQGVNEPQFR